MVRLVRTMVRYGTQVRLVRTKIAAEIAADSAAISAAILVRYHFSVS